MRRVLLACCLAVLLGAVDWSAPAARQTVEAASASVPPATAGVLLFVRGNDIWTMNADGSGQTQLTHEASGKFANDAVFSPDGTRIAFASHTPWTAQNYGASEIRVVNVDGTNDQTVVSPTQKGEWMDMPAWYGGGASLFYVHDTSQFDASGQWLSDTMTLEAMKLADGSHSVLMKNAEYPTTAPNGAMAWMSINPGTLGFQLNYTTDGSTVKTLVSSKDCMQIWQPKLSPDGQWIAFSCSGAKGPGAGGSGGGLFGIADLSFIPAAQAHGLPWDPYVIKTDGTNLHRLAALGTDEQGVAWSPDSSTVALAYYDGIFDVPLAGGPLAKVMAGGDASALDWKSAS